MLAMVSYSRRRKSGQITCYLNRTYHVLLTALPFTLDNRNRRIQHDNRSPARVAPQIIAGRELKDYEGDRIIENRDARGPTQAAKAAIAEGF